MRHSGILIFLIAGMILSGGGFLFPFSPEESSTIGGEAGSWPFFAFCIDTHDSMKRSLPQQAALLRELGFAGGGHLELPGVEERARTLAAEGLRLFQVYVTVDLAAKIPLDEARITEILPGLRPHRTHLALMIRGGDPSDTSLDDRATALIRRYSDMARPFGVRILLYPHTRFWLETSADAVRLAEKVNRPGDVGVMFNLGHWIRSDPDRDVAGVLKKSLPWLMAVSVNGTDRPETVKSGKGRWVRPLDRGEYSMRGFLNILRTTGFDGPVGLQCYGIRGDARVHLERSMTTWKDLLASFKDRPPEEGGGRKPGRSHDR